MNLPLYMMERPGSCGRSSPVASRMLRIRGSYPTTGALLATLSLNRVRFFSSDADFQMFHRSVATFQSAHCTCTIPSTWLILYICKSSRPSLNSSLYSNSFPSVLISTCPIHSVPKLSLVYNEDSKHSTLLPPPRSAQPSPAPKCPPPPTVTPTFSATNCKTS